MFLAIGCSSVATGGRGALGAEGEGGGQQCGGRQQRRWGVGAIVGGGQQWGWRVFNL